MIIDKLSIMKLKSESNKTNTLYFKIVFRNSTIGFTLWQAVWSYLLPVLLMAFLLVWPLFFELEIHFQDWSFPNGTVSWKYWSFVQICLTFKSTILWSIHTVTLSISAFPGCHRSSLKRSLSFVVQELDHLHSDPFGSINTVITLELQDILNHSQTKTFVLSEPKFTSVQKQIQCAN